MRKINIFQNFKKTENKSLLIYLLFTIFSLTVLTVIKSNSNPQIKSEYVWKIQAQGIAEELNLSGDNCVKLIEVYIASRRDLRKSLKEVAVNGNVKTKLQVQTVERKKLEENLNSFLSADEAAKAIQTLGSFNPRWDRYVSILIGYKLSKQKMNDALNLVSKYIRDYRFAREAAAIKGERFSSYTSKELKKSLDDGLANLLNNTQLTNWMEVTAIGKKKL